MIIYTAAILNQSASLPSGIVDEDQYSYLKSQLQGSRRVLLILNVDQTSNKVIVESATTASYVPPTNGSVRYDLTSKKLEYFSASIWVKI